MPEPIRVLISYSHDSEAHRERIRELAGRLRSGGIDAWIDQFSPTPAEGWPRWTERELARASFVIVACTRPYAERFSQPPGVGSGVGWEALLIRQEICERGGNTRFVPVCFDDDPRAVPLVLRPFTRYRLPAEYEALCLHLLGQAGAVIPPLGPLPAFEGARPEATGRRPAARTWNVPAQPAQFLPREELDALKVSLIASGAQAVAISGEHHRLGIQGMPGVGKTVLAAALAADADVHEAFPGGVFWLTFGRTPDDAAVWQGKLAAALAGRTVGIRTVREGKTTLGELFAERPATLLILDDVWNVEDADPFDAVSPPGRLLLTTRNREVAKALGATIRELQELRPADALTMLALYAARPVSALPPVAPDIVRECGELPLAVAMAGAMLQDRPDEQWPTLLEQLEKADLGYLEAALPQYRQHRSMLAAIEVSVQELPEEIRSRYCDLAMFAEDAAVPERVLQRLWAAGSVELAVAQRTVNRLVDRSLLRRDVKGRLTLHDLQHDYVRARSGDLASRHARLVEAYRSAVPSGALHGVESDGYFFESIARHVRNGLGPIALRELLLDHRWLAAKLRATSPNALLADFELLDLASDEPLRLLRDALRLSAHVLVQHPEELPSQLLGRLRSAPEPELRRLCERVEAEAGSPSLVPIWQSLTSPGGALLRTLEGHAGEVTAVALSEEGRIAVSGSSDRTLKVWNLETGTELHTLHGQATAVRAVALSRDGRRIVSGSDDWTVEVWDLETGEKVHRLHGHASAVRAVAVSADGKIAVSGSDDKTLGVWDLERGVMLRTLQGHAAGVHAVALSTDGTVAVSGSRDRTLRVWDVEAGRELHTFSGRRNWIYSVALSADGETVVSGSSERVLEVWNLKTREKVQELWGHAGAVYAVAISADGTTVVSGSSDNTLRAWGVRAGGEVHTLRGHASSVKAIALSANGKMAISGSSDGTLKVWNLEASKEPDLFQSHASSVRAVALSPDVGIAMSGSRDQSLKIWNLETGAELRTIMGHASSVNAVALSADGRTAVSGEWSLKVWDVKTGAQLHTLKGHLRWVNAVALSADGETAVSGSMDQTLKVWSTATGKELHTLQGHSGWVNTVALSADGRIAISGSSDDTLKIWDVSTGAELRTLRGHAGSVKAVALSTDERIAVSGASDDTLKVWNLETGAVLRTLQGHLSTVAAVALSPDGKIAFSGSNDRTLKVWTLATGVCLVTFTGDTAFTSLALDRSGRLFAGDSGGRVHLFELRLGS